MRLGNNTDRQSSYRKEKKKRSPEDLRERGMLGLGARCSVRIWPVLGLLAGLLLRSPAAADGRLVILPSQPTVRAGESISLEARDESGALAAVVWELESGPGTVGASSGLYQAPYSGFGASAVIRARSLSSPDVVARTWVRILEARLSVKPSPVWVRPGGTIQLQAVRSDGSTAEAYWEVVGGDANGTVSSGAYRAPLNPPSSVVWVLAQSRADPTNTAYGVILVGEGERLQVLPAAASVPLGGAVQFTAKRPSGAEAKVVWRIASGPGSISAEGVYRAPASYLGTPAEAVVEAVSVDPWAPGVGTATVTLAQVTVTVEPAEAECAGGGSVAFRATVTGAEDRRVTWLVASGPGVVGPDGVYTAPAAVSEPAAAVVRAVSTADPSKEASGLVRLRPVRVEVHPARAAVHAGNSLRFTAAVSYAADTAVQWLLAGGPGAIAPDGLYTAPETDAPAVARVRAVSRQDPSKWAEALVDILPHAKVVLTPQQAVLRQGASIQLHAEVEGSEDQRVTWRVDPPDAGILSAEGDNSAVYREPAVVQQSLQVTVTAVSTADGKASSSARITVLPPVAVELSAPARLFSGKTAKVSAQVANAVTSRDVLWSVSGESVTLERSGIGEAQITAASVKGPVYVEISAVSVEDPAARASARVLVLPPMGSAWVRPVPDRAMPGDVVEVLVEADANVLGVAGGSAAVSLPGGGTGFSFGMEQYPRWAPRPGPAFRSASYAVSFASGKAVLSISGSEPVGQVTAPWVVAVFPVIVLDGAAPGAYYFPLELDLRYPDGEKAPVSTASPVPLVVLPPMPTARVRDMRAAPGETVLAQIDVNRWAGKPSYPTVGLTVQADAGPRPQVLLNDLRPGELFAPGTGTLALSGGIVIMGDAERPGPGVLAEVPVVVPRDAKPGTHYELVPAVSQSIGNLRYLAEAGTLTVREPVTVSVEPKEVVVRRNGQVLFRAVVENADDPRVRWSLQGGDDAGEIGPDTGLYTAPLQRPSANSVTVTATSLEDPRASASARVIFAPDVVVHVPSRVEVPVGGSVRLEAVLDNVLPDEEEAVSWVLERGAPGELVDAGPLAVEYRAPKQMSTPAQAKLTARSTADPFAAAEVLIEIPQVLVTLDTDKSTVRPGEEVTLRAKVANAASGRVQWSLSGPGSLDEARAVYKAPPTLAEPAVVRIRAASVEDPTKSAEAKIELLPEPVVSVSGPNAPIPVGSTAALKADVQYVSDRTVKWQLISGPGQVDEQTGIYSAVPPMGTPAQAVVRAVSVEWPSAYADVTIQIARLEVRVEPASRQMRAGESAQFTASVANGTSATVRWRVLSGPGTVSDRGLYTAPADLAEPAAAVVRAESEEDPGAYAEAVVAVIPRPVLTVEPKSAELRVGETARFSASLQYLGGGVLWSLDGDEAFGSISSDGLYRAPDGLPEGMNRVEVVVRATAEADPSLTAEAKIAVRQVRVAAAPARYELNLGESVQLTARVSGASPGRDGVVWRLVAGVGQVDEQTGMYHAPAAGRTPMEVVLQAVSEDDPRAVASVEVSIRRVEVRVAPSEVTVRPGEEVTFAAEVINSTDRTVRWQVVEGTGSIGEDGRYRAPSKVEGPAQAVVRATSRADDSVYADAVVHLKGRVTVAVAPAQVELEPGQSVVLRAEVSNADDPSVRWELVSGGGVLTDDGVYTAPPQVPEPFTAVARAVSKEDPNASASAKILVRGTPRLELWPLDAETELGGEVRFRAEAANTPAGAVLVWEVVEGPGTAADGVYKAPDAGVTPAVARVRVSVDGQGDLRREAVVRIREVSVAASAEREAVNQGERVRLTAMVAGARNQAVEWSVASGPGRVSADGVFEAPEELTHDAEAVVVATSAADRSKQAAVRLKLIRAWIEVSPAEAAVQLGAKMQFSAAVHGLEDVTVRWTVEGPGTIDENGLYAAPSAGTTPAEVVVTAESSARAGVKGTARVLIPEVRVHVEPADAEVSAGGQSVKLAAVVSGALDTRVLWSVEGGADSGSVDADGMYRSPADPGYSGVVVVKAASAADPSKWAAARVMVRPQPAPVGGHPWPMFLHDAQHTGMSGAVGPRDPVLKWKVPVSASFSSPAVAEDGTIYIGSTDRSLVAVDPLGEVRWALADTGGGSGWVRSSPAIGQDGTVYAVDASGDLIAVSGEGRVLRRTALSGGMQTGGYSSPAVAEDGTVYAVGSDVLFAFSPGGEELWRQTLGGFTASSPAVGPGGTVYVGCDDGAVYAIGRDGKVLWRFWTTGGVRSSPAVGRDGTVYFGSSDGHGYAVGADGKEKWRIATGGEVVAAPALGPDDRVYFASSDAFLYALAGSGTLMWRFRTGGPLVVAPIVDAEGTVYVAGGDKKLYAVKPDGTLRWVYETTGLLNSSPVIAGPGLMYLPCGDGYVHVLGTRGDTDGDGRVTVVDAVIALRIALGLQLPRKGQLELADISPEGSPPGDGRVTVQDATRILRRAVGLG